MRHLYLSLIFLVISATSFGQLASGDYRTKMSIVTWSTASHWQVRTGSSWATASVPPGASNNVYIQSGHTVTLTANAACKDLHLSNTLVEPRLALDQYTLSVNGKIRAYSGNASVGTIDGNLPGTSAFPSNTSNWISCSTGKLMITGNSRTVFNSTEWDASNVGSPQASTNGFDLEINLNSSSDVVISQAPIKARTITITSGTLDMGSHWISADQGSSGNGSITINGTLKSSNSGVALSNIVLSRAQSSRIGTLTIGSTGVLSLNGADPRIDANTIVNNGKVIYNDSVQYGIRPSATDPLAVSFNTYKDFTIAGSGVKNLPTNITVNGTFSRQGSASINAGAFSINYGPLSTLEYAGIVPQTTGPELPATNGPANLQINNAAGVILSAPRTITGNLNLISGVLTTNSTNLLTLADNATVTNATDGSYVDGPINKVGDDAFTFPVGKGGKYRPITMTAPSNTTDVFSAEYFHASHTQGGYSALGASGLDHVSQVEYWNLGRLAGSSNPEITLSWNPQSLVSVAPLSDLRVAHYNGTVWDNLGNAATSGNESNGTITASTASLSSFSPFTLATVSQNQPLPIHLLSFNGNSSEGHVNLEWKTTCESDMHQFDIEFASGTDFNTIGQVVARNEGCGANTIYRYNSLAANGNDGLYRLKMIDIAGRYIYSNTIRINSKEGSQNNISFLYNPALDVLQISGFNNSGNYQINDLTGRVITSGKLAGSMENINIADLQSGVYFFVSGGNPPIKFVKF